MLTAVSHLPGQVSKLYRVSDDDFAIMIEGNFTDRQLTNICEKIKARYHDAVMEQGQLLGCGISMGIYPKLNAALSAEEILRKATRTSQFASKKKPIVLRFTAQPPNKWWIAFSI